MALFMNAGAKEPLVERQTKEVIAKRGAETVGILLLILSGLLSIMLAVGPSRSSLPSGVCALYSTRAKIAFCPA